jgi:hypothetical protein
MITYNNLEEYRDPINYDLEFGLLQSKIVSTGD